MSRKSVTTLARKVAASLGGVCAPRLYEQDRVTPASRSEWTAHFSEAMDCYSSLVCCENESDEEAATAALTAFCAKMRAQHATCSSACERVLAESATACVPDGHLLYLNFCRAYNIKAGADDTLVELLAKRTSGTDTRRYALLTTPFKVEF
jgi:hypothetical protein